MGDAGDLDELAAAVMGREPAPSALRSIWLLADHAQPSGPYTEQELAGMLLEGSVAPSCFARRDGTSEWVPISRLIPMPRSNSAPVSYATPSSLRPAGRLARYRRRVGHRSFIFQIWLALWTASYAIWILSLLVAADSHTSSSRAYMSAPSIFTTADQLFGLTSGWITLVLGWSLMGVPVGIAAVATMENNNAGMQ